VSPHVNRPSLPGRRSMPWDVDVNEPLEGQGGGTFAIDSDIRSELPNEFQAPGSIRSDRHDTGCVAEGAGATDDNHVGDLVRGKPGRIILDLLSEECPGWKGYLNCRVSLLAPTGVRDDDVRLGGEGADELTALGEGD